MNRKSAFRRGLAAAVRGMGLLAWLVADPVPAAWVEVGPGSGTAAPPPPTPWLPPPPYEPPPPPPPPPPPSYDPYADAVRRLLAEAWLGGPYGHSGLTVHPILVGSRPPRGEEMLTLDEAVRRGSLRVTEVGAGSVPSLLVVNHGRRPVFLLAGEILLGGKQDRVLRQDVVVPPHATIEVSVYCVEKGRWDARASRGAAFDSAPSVVADGALRSRAAAGRSQEDIWSHVERKSAEAGVSSATGAYRSYVESPAVTRRLDEIVSRCAPPSAWRGRAVGAVFTSAGRVLGVELFDDSRLMRELWPKLVRSYAMQVSVYGGDDGRGAAMWALQALRASDARFVEWSGGGARVAIDLPGFHAGGIVWNGRATHVAALVDGFEVPYLDPPPPFDP